MCASHPAISSVGRRSASRTRSTRASKRSALPTPKAIRGVGARDPMDCCRTSHRASRAHSVANELAPDHRPAPPTGPRLRSCTRGLRSSPSQPFSRFAHAAARVRRRPGAVTRYARTPGEQLDRRSPRCSAWLRGATSNSSVADAPSKVTSVASASAGRAAYSCARGRPRRSPSIPNEASRTSPCDGRGRDSR